MNFSFKIFRLDALRKIHLTAQSVFVDGELLAQARRSQGLTIREVPVEYKPREHGVANFDSPKSAIATLIEMLRYRLAPQYSERAP